MYDLLVDESKSTNEEQVIGIVTDCMRLNIRSEPRADAPIVCTISCLTEVMIDEDESTQDYYKIYLASGLDGFCVKKFIAVRQFGGI